VAFDPDDVVVTPGGNTIMFFSILALVDEGDEVIYPNPGFPIYESMIQFVGGTASRSSSKGCDSPDVEKLCDLITPRAFIILNSPHNPTGGMLARADLGHRGRRAPASRPHRALRRNLQPHAVRGRYVGRRTARHARHTIVHGFQNLRDDGLAAGCRLFRRRWPRRRAANDQQTRAPRRSHSSPGWRLEGPQDARRRMVRVSPAA
jgi:hypothetical protein